MIKFEAAKETVIDPFWGALAMATASLFGTSPVVSMWIDAGKSYDGGGFGKMGLMLVGPVIYLFIFGIVGKLLVWLLSKTEEPAHRAGIVGAALVIPLIGRGMPFLWEIILAAVMGAYVARHFHRVLKDEEDLKRL